MSITRDIDEIVTRAPINREATSAELGAIRKALLRKERARGLRTMRQAFKELETRGKAGVPIPLSLLTQCDRFNRIVQDALAELKNK